MGNLLQDPALLSAVSLRGGDEVSISFRGKTFSQRSLGKRLSAGGFQSCRAVVFRQTFSEMRNLPNGMAMHSCFFDSYLKSAFAAFVALLAFADVGHAGAGVTYHGRLLKPDGTPVTSNVRFKLQIRTPGNENCLLYQETQLKDLSASNGIFAITLNDGSAGSVVSGPFTLDRAFQNRGPMTFLSDCTGGSTYNPSPSDGRRLVVEFNDGNGWEPIPSQAINFVPMALESITVGGFDAKSLLRVENGGEPVSVDALSPSQSSVLLDLIKGTSSLYRSSADPVPVASLAGTVMTAQIADGAVTDAKLASGISGAKVNGNISGKAAGFTGDLDGDVKGAQGATSVVKLQGRAVDSAQPANGQVLKWNDLNNRWEPANDAVGSSGGGISSLNGSSESTQSFTTGAAGNAPGWSTNSASGVHTLNIPLASSSSTVTAGLISNAEYSALSGKLSSVSGAANLANAKIWIGDSGGKAQEQTLAGDASIIASGTVTVTGLRGKNINSVGPTVAGQVLRFDGTEYKAAFLGLADVRSTAVPGSAMFASASCSADKTLFWSSLTDQFTCQSISIGDANITAVAATKITGNVPAAQVSGLGALSALSVGTGLISSGGNLSADFGAAAGKVAQGNDSRFPSTACGSGNKMRWDGSAWQCEVSDSTDPTKVAKTGDTMSGSLTLAAGTLATPANGLVVGGTQLVASGGNVGIGTASPKEILDVNGAVRVGDTASACSSTNAGAVKYVGGVHLVCDGTIWNQLTPMLTADRTYYVNPATGSNSNSGLAAGQAFKTINYAISVARSIHPGQFGITIQLADGTYAENVNLHFPYPSEFQIIGNTTNPSNVLIAPPSGSAISVADGGWIAKGMKVSCASSVWGCIYVGKGKIVADKIVFGSSAGNALAVGAGGYFAAGGSNLYVMGTMTNDIFNCGGNGLIDLQGATVTAVANTAFVNNLSVNSGCFFNGQSTTWTSGGFTITGKRYVASYNGVIQTYGTTPFGSTAGTTSNGGIYY